MFRIAGSLIRIKSNLISSSDIDVDVTQDRPPGGRSPVWHQTSFRFDVHRCFVPELNEVSEQEVSEALVFALLWIQSGPGPDRVNMWRTPCFILDSNLQSSHTGNSLISGFIPVTVEGPVLIRTLWTIKQTSSWRVIQVVVPVIRRQSCRLLVSALDWNSALGSASLTLAETHRRPTKEKKKKENPINYWYLNFLWGQNIIAVAMQPCQLIVRV